MAAPPQPNPDGLDYYRWVLNGLPDGPQRAQRLDEWLTYGRRALRDAQRDVRDATKLLAAFQSLATEYGDPPCRTHPASSEPSPTAANS